MLRVKTRLDRVKSLVAESLLEADARHGAPSVGLDEYLTLLILMGTHLASEIVICTQEPLSVPTVFPDRIHHFIDVFLCPVSLGITAQVTAKLHVVTTAEYEQTGNHKALGLAALGLVLGGLEALVGIIREAVQVHAVIPVGTSYQRQSVRTKVVDHMIE